jgi:hypothetical protein
MNKRADLPVCGVGRQPFADVRSPGDALATVEIQVLLESG